MLRKLRLFYYNNKIKIWAVVGIIVFVYIIIRLINANVRINNQKENENIINNVNNKTIQESKNVMPSTNTAVITNTKISNETLKDDTDLIKNFIENCNNNNVEAAYNMLSDDCKDELYKTQDRFNENYIKEIFSQKRSYDMQAWEKYSEDCITYKIKYIEDIMATGKVDDEYIEDYITIIKQNDDKKLNINQFIKKEEVNKEKEENNLKISVLNKYIYYDYVEYEAKFENIGEDDITIDTKNDTKSIYIVNSDGVKYEWYGNEVPNQYLTLHKSEDRTFRMRFNEMYSARKSDSEMCFTDVHLNSQNNDEKSTIKINI